MFSFFYQRLHRFTKTVSLVKPEVRDLANLPCRVYAIVRTAAFTGSSISYDITDIMSPLESWNDFFN
jgi:hypothetical protein